MASILFSTMLMLVLFLLSHFALSQVIKVDFSSISAAPAILPGADEPSPSLSSPPALSPDILPVLPTTKGAAPSPSDDPTTIPSSPSPPNPDFFLPPGSEPDVAFPPSGLLPAASRASSSCDNLRVNLVVVIGVMVLCFKQLLVSG
ncbi:hypothetical protein ACFE04_017712 [Oxalis oulophora]